jgi:hypothetical protein
VLNSKLSASFKINPLFAIVLAFQSFTACVTFMSISYVEFIGFDCVNSRLVAPDAVYQLPPPTLDPVKEAVTPAGYVEASQGVPSPDSW